MSEEVRILRFVGGVLTTAITGIFLVNALGIYRDIRISEHRHIEELALLRNQQELQVLQHPNPLQAVAALNGLAPRRLGELGMRYELFPPFWQAKGWGETNSGP